MLFQGSKPSNPIALHFLDLNSLHALAGADMSKIPQVRIYIKPKVTLVPLQVQGPLQYSKISE